ncbi:MAG: TAXI family TRAP transporter solute-binding subunit [Cloacibacillus sp.]
MRKFFVSATLSVILVLSLAFSVFAEDYKLVVAGGPQGGAWYGLAGALGKEIEAAIPGVRTSVIPGGGVGNIVLVEKGEAKLATTVSHLYNSGVKGTAPYTGLNAKHLLALANIGTSDTCLFLVKKNFPANNIQEIKDKKLPIKLITTSKASTPALGTLRILSEYGITPEDIVAWGGNISYMNYADAAQLISDGHADGIVAPVVPALVELSKTTPLKLLPLQTGVIDKLVSKYGYSKIVMKKGSYTWITKDLPVLGEPNILLIHSSVPEDIAYKITKLICEKPELIRAWGNHHASFKAQTASNNVGGELHPGAIKYYKEKGYLKK